MNNDRPVHPEDRKKLAEGRGQGSGPGYRAWIEAPELSSDGKKAQIWSLRSGRNLNAFSLLEQYVAILADQDTTIDEILDQKVICPIQETVAIANERKLQHPRFGKWLKALSTDFLFRRIDGTYFGRTVKYAYELADPDVLAKFEIEEEWYKRRGWDWGIYTEKTIDIRRAKNLLLLRAYRNPKKLSLPPEKVERLRLWSEPLLKDALSFADLAEASEHALALPVGTPLQTFRHFIAVGRWRVDLSNKLEMTSSGGCRNTLILNQERTAYVPVAA